MRNKKENDFLLPKIGLILFVFTITFTLYVIKSELIRFSGYNILTSGQSESKQFLGELHDDLLFGTKPGVQREMIDNSQFLYNYLFVPQFFSAIKSFKPFFKLPGEEYHTTSVVRITRISVFSVMPLATASVLCLRNTDRLFTVTSAQLTGYYHLFAVILFIVLLIIGIFQYLTWRTKIIRQKLEDERRFAELQFRTLRNQLAPHFIFNALNAIGSSIYQDDKEKSYDFLQRFSTLIRSTLIHADKTYRKLSDEIDFVKNYLELEKFRFENKFDYLISLPDDIDPDLPVPKMIIQTFAENAVKHGLVEKTNRGMLSISLRRENDYLVIVIEDDGIGRIESLKLNTHSTGRGMEIMSEFITLFNKFNEKKIHYEIEDVASNSGKDSGTRVTIKLPIDFTYNSIIQTP